MSFLPVFVVRRPLVLLYLDAEKKMTFGRVRAFYTVELDFIQFYFEFFTNSRRNEMRKETIGDYLHT